MKNPRLLEMFSLLNITRNAWTDASAYLQKEDENILRVHTKVRWNTIWPLSNCYFLPGYTVLWYQSAGSSTKLPLTHCREPCDYVTQFCLLRRTRVLSALLFFFLLWEEDDCYEIFNLDPEVTHWPERCLSVLLGNSILKQYLRGILIKMVQHKAIWCRSDWGQFRIMITIAI